MASYKYAYNDEEKEQMPPKLPTNRSMWKLMLLNIVTLGIYSNLFFVPFSFDLDKVDPHPDRPKTTNYIFVYILSLFTFSIVLLLWHHHIAERVDEALVRRHIDYEFDTNTLWGWYFFGSFILIGQFVYFHKLCRAMNLLCEHYNEHPVVE